MVFKAIARFFSNWSDSAAGVDVGAFDDYPKYLNEYLDLMTEFGGLWVNLCLEADRMVSIRSKGEDQLVELAQCVAALEVWITELNAHANEFTSVEARNPDLPKRLVGEDMFRRDLILRRWRARCALDEPPGRPRKALMAMGRLLCGSGVIAAELSERLGTLAQGLQESENEDIFVAEARQLQRCTEKLSVWTEEFMQYAKRFVPEYPAWMHLLLTRKVGD